MLTALVRTVKHDPSLSNDEVDGNYSCRRRRISEQHLVCAFAILLQATLLSPRAPSLSPKLMLNHSHLPQTPYSSDSLLLLMIRLESLQSVSEHAAARGDGPVQQRIRLLASHAAALAHNQR